MNVCSLPRLSSKCWEIVAVIFCTGALWSSDGLAEAPPPAASSAAPNEQTSAAKSPNAKPALPPGAVDLSHAATKFNPSAIAEFAAPKPSGQKPLLADFNFSAPPPEPNVQLRNVTQYNEVIDLDGQYEFNGKPEGGYRVVLKTPDLDYQKFTVVVRLLPDDFGVRENPLFVGGTGSRWLVLSSHPRGNLTFSLNNGRFFQPIPDVKLTPAEWVSVAVSFDLSVHAAAVYVNGDNVAKITLPEDLNLDVIGSKAEKSDKVWTFTNYSNGSAFKGLVGELLVFGEILTEAQIRGLEMPKGSGK